MVRPLHAINSFPSSLVRPSGSLQKSVEIVAVTEHELVINIAWWIISKPGDVCLFDTRNKTPRVIEFLSNPLLRVEMVSIIQAPTWLAPGQAECTSGAAVQTLSQ